MFEQIKKNRQLKKEALQQNKEILSSLNLTSKVGKYYFDDKKGYIVFREHFYSRKYAVSYDSIKSVGIKEIRDTRPVKTKTKRKGVVTRTVVGGVLGGGVGAVVGGLTSGKETVSKVPATHNQVIMTYLVVSRESVLKNEFKLKYSDALMLKVQEIVDNNQ